MLPGPPGSCVSDETTPDPYEVLGVPTDASDEVIKQAYRRCARTCHPDLHGDNAEAAAQFNRVSLAYQLLSRPMYRKFWDKYKVDPEAYGLEYAEIVAAVRENKSLYVAPDDLVARATCPHCNGTGKRPSGRVCTKCSTHVRPKEQVVHERPIPRAHSRYRPEPVKAEPETPIASDNNKRIRMTRAKKPTAKTERIRVKKP